MLLMDIVNDLEMASDVVCTDYFAKEIWFKIFYNKYYIDNDEYLNTIKTIDSSLFHN